MGAVHPLCTLSMAPAKRAVSKPHLVPLTPALLARARKFSRSERAGNVNHRLAFKPGMSVALVQDNQVLGAGGIAHYAGRMQAWMLVSRHARKREIVAGVRLAQRWLAIKAKEFPRIEIYISAHSPWRESFAAALDLIDTGKSDVFPECAGVMCLYLKTAEG